MKYGGEERESKDDRKIGVIWLMKIKRGGGDKDKNGEKNEKEEKD